MSSLKQTNWGRLVNKQGGQRVVAGLPRTYTALNSYDGPRAKGYETWRAWQERMSIQALDNAKAMRDTMTAKQWAEHQKGEAFKRREHERKTASAALAWRRTFPLLTDTDGDSPQEHTLFDKCQAISTRGDSYASGRHWWPSGDAMRVTLRVPDAEWVGTVLMCPRHTATYHRPSWGNVGTPTPYAARQRSAADAAAFMAWRSK